MPPSKFDLNVQFYSTVNDLSISEYNVQGVKDFTGIISSHGDNYNVQGVLNTGYSDTATGVKGAQENSNTRGVVNTGIFRKETK
ncbi:hypothetical protein FF38_13634 [Lucilia cuprina]|uniref:Uncharacterized protein n=1 Tax=Lucilia cuprina TaxID=7375 RepID=A0A0L0CA87_LUCCU|nr:hypothetical protein FF38_13634 [Lucilia cuprina]